MATSFKPVKGRAYKFYIGLVDQANTKLLKANPTIASGDFQISKDGGSFANLTTLPSANPASGRAIMINLSSTETTADNIVIQCVDAAGAEWCDQLIAIETREQKSDYFHFVMRDTSGNPATGKTVTVTRVIDNGSFGAGTVGSVTEIANGVYRVALPLADLNAQDCTTLYATATGCMPTLITLTSAY
jgi:hypothetical protein